MSQNQPAMEMFNPVSRGLPARQTGIFPFNHAHIPPPLFGPNNSFFDRPSKFLSAPMLILSYLHQRKTQMCKTLPVHWSQLFSVDRAFPWKTAATDPSCMELFGGI